MYFAAQPASQKQRHVVTGLCVALFVGGLALLPVAGLRLPPLPHVAALFGLTSATINLATFLLLRAAPQPPMSQRLLAAAYLYAGLMAIVHVLVYPGAILEGRPLLGDASTVTWLFNAWHAGFAAFVLAAAAAQHRQWTWGGRARPEVVAAAAWAGAVALSLGLAAGFEPSSFGPAFTRVGVFVSFGCSALAVVTLAVVLRTGLVRQLLWLWMALVLSADAAGMFLSTAGGGRYTLSWYGTRLEGVLSSLVVFALLSWHFRTVQIELVRTVGDLRQRTDDLQAEIQRRERAERMLLQAQKLEAVGQLAAGLAHDFNNMMQVVTARVEILRRRVEPQVDADVDVIRKTIRRAEGLTRQLMLFTGRRQVQLKTVHLQRILPEFVSMLHPLVRSDVSLELALPDDLAPVCVDVEELEIALTNLVANARDAMPRGGAIRIEASDAFAKEDGRHGVELRVRDEGEGIPPQMVERVFEPFFTTKGPDQGTGLGLSQVYAFARSAGGTVSIESALGKGTVVTLLLPTIDDHPSGDDAAGQPMAAPVAARRGPIDILVVDDNADIRESTAMLLEHAGHVVKSAATASDALAMLADGYQPAAVLSDIVMPGELDGFGLAKQISKRYPHIRVVLATGYSSAGDLARADGLVVLQKPYVSSALMQALQL